MKLNIFNLDKYAALKMIFLVAVFGLCLCISSGSAGDKLSPGDELVSLNVQDKPLSEVLEIISKATGYQFVVAREWLDFPVSASVNAMPLHKALKRMFGELSHAVIYGSDRKIKIMIYGENATSAAAGSGNPVMNPSSEQSLSTYEPAQEIEPQDSEPEATEDRETPETEEETQPEPGQSDQTSDDSSSQIQEQAQNSEADSGGTDQTEPGAQKEETSETGQGN